MSTTAIKPIVEFLELDKVASKREAKQELFSEQYDERTYRYLQGAKEALQKAYGIYVFYDSRGRAIYAGKAVKQSLWREMNGAYNRNRGDLQTIRLVSHPIEKGTFTPSEEKTRRIFQRPVQLWQFASYVSAYQIDDKTLISTFEALIVRAFANDLLNKRMESF